MQSQQILLLINPLAKRKIIEEIVTQITSALSKRNIDSASFIGNWPTNINVFKEAWIIGGDGTVNFFLNAYPFIEIPIVIFRGGTGNDFATKLYGRINIAEQVKVVLAAEPKYVDAAECNGRKFINGIGIGFDGEVLKSMNAIRVIGGHLGYLWLVLQKIFSYKEQHYQIHYDEAVYSGRLLLVMITNSTTTGGGFKVSPEAEIDDGKLNMVLCKPLSIVKRLRNLPVIEKGKHLHRNFILHKTITAINIECKFETLAQIDGELICAETFEIKVLPRYYRFKY